MDKYLIFHASGVDSSSVTSHDTGTDIDLACFPASAITAIMGRLINPNQKPKPQNSKTKINLIIN